MGGHVQQPTMQVHAVSGQHQPYIMQGQMPMGSDATFRAGKLFFFVFHNLFYFNGLTGAGQQNMFDGLTGAVMNEYG